MRSYREIANFLLIREQLSLGWKISFFIVCGALVYGSLILGQLRLQAVDILGTVVSDRAESIENTAVSYLTIKLDNGETVRASATTRVPYRPGRRVVVKEVRSKWSGVRKHEFKSYVDEASRG